MRNVFAIIGLCLSAMVALSSCAVDTTGTAPSYARLDSLLPADTAGRRQDAQVQNRIFPDAAFYIGGKYIGTYELGIDNFTPGQGTQAVLNQTGSRYVVVYPVVRADGQAARRVQYPFYQADSSLLTLAPDGRFNLGTKVLREVKRIARPYPLAEDFEQESLSVDSGTGTRVRLQVKRDTLGRRGRFGYCYVAPGTFVRRFAQVAAKSFVRVPQNTTLPLYLELDYRSTTPITVGLYFPLQGQVQFLADVVFKASPDGWRREYVFLSDEAASIPQGTPVKAFIASTQADTSQPFYMAVDNLRLLHLGPRL